MSTGGTAAPTDGPQTNRHWALFADWCTATDRNPLPAGPETVHAFLAELPAGPATVLRRLLAIDTAHRAAGMTPPGADPAFDSFLRPYRPPRFAPDLVVSALAAVPVGGWPVGIVGRRDAALVALVCCAGMTRRHARALCCGLGPGDAPGVPAAAGTLSGAWAMPVMVASDDPGACPACALSRWQRVAATIAAAGWRSARAELADIGETRAGSETSHDCIRPVTWPQPIRAASPGWDPPLFTAIDRRGVPQASYPLSVRSITTIVTTRLIPAVSGELWDAPDMAAADLTGGSWGETDRARVLTERKQAMNRLASYETVLDEADAYAEAILERLEARLNGADTNNGADDERRQR